jgi:PII-like signaling protein
MQMVARRRVEILTDSPLLPRLVAALNEAGITGHTAFPASSGSGHTGAWAGGDLSGAEAKIMLMAIASDEAVARLVDLVSPLLNSHRLLLAVSDVAVVRGDRF